ncbi:hypothetical protein HELRODRAFT_191051 [Helobdella robusta]|uniref:G-protein coupled receptors family 1 profile domain-containing protein n=1 Tax=Helobdella robusta TaxID=6412 RepID=T1FSJ6_HELRO|nr:hypothetical protein HELRODRAFT_191051 [Helobdella robusta]ESO07816.1 hypothetical protein HELRODRAFT_191051 [Helobdella robusta]
MTTTTTTMAIDDSPSKVARNFWIIFGPCLFTIGIIGNILILLVMRQPIMRGTSTCLYLCWMALADVFALISGMVPEWLEYSGILVFKEISPNTCKLEKLTFYTSGDASIWICISFTIDRLMAVCFPFVESFTHTPVSANYNVMLIFFLALVKNLHVIWTRGAEYKVVEHLVSNVSFYNGVNASHSENFTTNTSTEVFLNRTVQMVFNETILLSNCGSPTKEYRYFERYVRPWIASTLVSFIPSIVIVICNFFIVRKLLHLKSNKNKIPSESEQSTVLQMTILCLTASICFVVCNIPSLIMLIGKPYWQDAGGRTTSIYNLAKPIVNQIFYVNHSANFFLYCVTGKRFRQTLYRMLKCKCCYNNSHCCCCNRTEYNFILRHSNNCSVPIVRFKKQPLSSTGAAENKKNILGGGKLKSCNVRTGKDGVDTDDLVTNF